MAGIIPAMTLILDGLAEPEAPIGDEVRFVVYGEAKSGGSKKAFKHPRTDRIILTEQVNNRAWKQQVAGAGLEAIASRSPAPLFTVEALAVEFLFVRPRPRGHFGASGLRPSAPAHPTTRPDVLKLARAVEDALTGIVWRDDSQIVHETLRKVFGEPERLEVVVRPLA